MGKTKGKGHPKAKGGGPRAPAARVTPQQLYEQAQLALQYDDFDSARTALRKAVKLDPKNIECVDALGALLAEVGPEEEAVEVRCVKLDGKGAGCVTSLLLHALLWAAPGVPASQGSWHAGARWRP